MKTRCLLLLVAMLSGCGSQNVPPEKAKVTLSNPRVEHERGEDVFLVDYKFTTGRPERGWRYQLVITSDSGNEYTVDRLFNEKQVSGTLEGRFRHFDANREPSKNFQAFFQMQIGSTMDMVNLSNTVEFKLPAS